MQVYGNIASPIEKRVSKAGKDYYTFRLAENWGKRDDPQRTTTWYDVSAFIAELDADMLAKGQYVKINGRLNVQTFTRRNGELAAAAVLLTNAVEPVEARKRPEDEVSSEQRPAAPAPAAASAPKAREYQPVMDDLDDDPPF